MIEKVAINLFKNISSIEEDVEYEFSKQRDTIKEHYFMCARAAIEAMRSYCEETGKSINDTDFS